MAVKSRSASLLGFVDKEILRPLETLGEEAQKDAVKICKAHKNTLRSEFKNEIIAKKAKPRYVSQFTVRKYNKKHIAEYGAKLWNRKYPLSHLLEDGHVVKNQYGGPYKPIKHGPYSDTSGDSDDKTHAFNLWEKEEEKIVEEFTQAVSELVKKL